MQLNITINSNIIRSGPEDAGVMAKQDAPELITAQYSEIPHLLSELTEQSNASPGFISRCEQNWIKRVGIISDFCVQERPLGMYN